MIDRFQNAFFFDDILIVLEEKESPKLVRSTCDSSDGAVFYHVDDDILVQL